MEIETPAPSLADEIRAAEEKEAAQNQRHLSNSPILADMETESYLRPQRIESETGRGRKLSSRRSTITTPVLSVQGEVLAAAGEPGEITPSVATLFQNYATGGYTCQRTVEDIQALSVKRKTTKANRPDHELFMELIYDIQHELDVERLCFRILHNIAVLTNCDRSSLFLTRSDGSDQFLICKLFDLTSGSRYEDVCQSEDNTFIIPFGQGVLGHVAESKQFVKINNAYQVKFHIYSLNMWISQSDSLNHQ